MSYSNTFAIRRRFTRLTTFSLVLSAASAMVWCAPSAGLFLNPGFWSKHDGFDSSPSTLHTPTSSLLAWNGVRNFMHLLFRLMFYPRGNIWSLPKKKWPTVASIAHLKNCGRLNHRVIVAVTFFTDTTGQSLLIYIQLFNYTISLLSFILI